MGWTYTAMRSPILTHIHSFSLYKNKKHNLHGHVCIRVCLLFVFIFKGKYSIGKKKKSNIILQQPQSLENKQAVQTIL